MKHVMMALLIALGIHGVRHNYSHRYLNLVSYQTKRTQREKRLCSYMHDQGLGA